MILKTYKVLGLLMLSVLIHASSFAQKETNKYDIVLAGFTIGQMNAIKTVDQSEIDYQIHSLVEFWFFGKIHVEFLQQVHYEDDLLIKSKTHSDSNRGDFVTTVDWKTDHYKVDANSYKFHNDEPIKQPIYLSTAMLYFQEPKEGDVLISENFGMLTKIVRIEEGVYEIDVNGNMNRFYYEGGVLQKVVLENKIKNYVIKKAED